MNGTENRKSKDISKLFGYDGHPDYKSTATLHIYYQEWRERYRLVEIKIVGPRGQAVGALPTLRALNNIARECFPDIKFSELHIDVEGLDEKDGKFGTYTIYLGPFLPIKNEVRCD